MAGQGHHLVALLVGADDDGEPLDLADGVGVQAGVAIVMRAFAHAVELITGLFQQAQSAELVIDLVVSELFVDGSAKSTFGSIWNWRMLLLLVSELSRPLTRNQVNPPNDVEPCGEGDVLGYDSL